jgi:hypothetical protein
MRLRFVLYSAGVLAPGVSSLELLTLFRTGTRYCAHDIAQPNDTAG